MLEDKEAADIAESVRNAMARLQTIKNLVRDGKYVVAYEKIQGMSDNLANILGRLLPKEPE